MTIDRLHSMEPTPDPQRNAKSGKPGTHEGKDSISISRDAEIASELYQIAETAKNAPEMSVERINALKKMINDPEYLSNPAIIEKTANKIIEQLFRG